MAPQGSVRMRSIRSAVAVALVAVAFSATAVSPAANAAAAPEATVAAGGTAIPMPASVDPPSGALVPGGKSPDLNLIASGDVIGFIDPCG